MINILRMLKKTRRIQERVPLKMIVPFEVMLQYSYDKMDYTGLLKDISSNGLGFFSSRYLEPGKQIEIEVILECKETGTDFRWVALKEKAEIKWVKVNHSSSLVDYDIGCQFIGSVDENREKLAMLLKHILEKS